MKQLLDFQLKVNAIKKDGKNPHFKSTYATLSQILSEVKPILSECKLVVLQPINDGKVGTILVDETGKEIAISWIELPSGLNPQQMGSAITYYRRYTLASLLSLELEDDDGNEASKVIPKVKATESTVKAMLEAISQGRKDQVKDKMKNYEFTEIQLQTLNLALK